MSWGAPVGEVEEVYDVGEREVVGAAFAGPGRRTKGTGLGVVERSLDEVEVAEVDAEESEPGDDARGGEGVAELRGIGPRLTPLGRVGGAISLWRLVARLPSTTGRGLTRDETDETQPL